MVGTVSGGRGFESPGMVPGSNNTNRSPIIVGPVIDLAIRGWTFGGWVVTW